MIEEILKDKKGFVQAKGRAIFQAPEVDGNIYVEGSKDILPGDFIKVRITDGYAYDLIGEKI